VHTLEVNTPTVGLEEGEYACAKLLGLALVDVQLRQSTKYLSHRVLHALQWVLLRPCVHCARWTGADGVRGGVVEVVGVGRGSVEDGDVPIGTALLQLEDPRLVVGHLLLELETWISEI